MKKTCLIVMIALFLFNLFGYRLLFNYLQWRADTRLESTFDRAEYNEADLVTITVPLSVPYQIDQSAFQRIDGEVLVNGKVLKYVKRKVSNGNLVLLCLPDNNKMRLQSAKDDFFKSNNDLVQNNQSKSGHSKAGAFKNLLSDYLPHTPDDAITLNTLQAARIASRPADCLPSSPHNSPEQPPDVT